MANKYSGLSDFEVNKLILNKLGIEIYDGYQSEPEIKAYTIEGKTRFLFDFDYCNSYSDAFKLMIANEIDLLKGRLHSSKGKWVAVKSMKCYTDNPTKSINENPCRAIAECFLLMKDAEKE